MPDDEGPTGHRTPKSQELGAGKRILLVEDDPSAQFIYRTILEYAGFDVVVASDGGHAVALAREELPDLILTDINLPILSGWAIGKELKSDRATSHIPIIAMSASSASENELLASLHGFEAFFTKPLSPQVVLSAVQAALRIGTEP